MLDRHPLRPVPASNGLSLDELTELECRARRDREKAARYERLHRLERGSARCTAAHVEQTTATARRTGFEREARVMRWPAAAAVIAGLSAALWGCGGYAFGQCVGWLSLQMGW